MEGLPKTFYRASIKGLLLDETRTKFAVILEDNGFWELPGGGLDWPEKTEECLRRELKEEMGLTVTEVSPTPAYFMVGENRKGTKSINVVFEIKVKDLNITPSPECLEMKFVSPEEAATMNAFRNVKELAAMFDSKKHL